MAKRKVAVRVPARNRIQTSGSKQKVREQAKHAAIHIAKDWLKRNVQTGWDKARYRDVASALLQYRYGLDPQIYANPIQEITYMLAQEIKNHGND